MPLTSRDTRFIAGEIARLDPPGYFLVPCDPAPTGQRGETIMLSDREAQDLNFAVGKAMGWTARRTLLWGASPAMGRGEDTYTLVWDGPTGDTTDFGDLPDFCRDRMAFGYLLEWLDRSGLDWCLSHYPNDRLSEPPIAALRGAVTPWHYCPGETTGECLCRVIIAYTEAKNATDKP